MREACRRFPAHIIVGIDAKDGWVATEGWADVSSVDVIDLAKAFADAGVSSIVYTDIARDGMMQVSTSKRRPRLPVSGLPVIASGGVTNMDDIRRLVSVADAGVGAITGRADLRRYTPICRDAQCDEQTKWAYNVSFRAWTLTTAGS